MSTFEPAIRESFQEFIARPDEALRVRLRRDRATELRRMFAAPGWTVEGFNKEVWLVEASTTVDGKDITGQVYEPLTAERAAELEAARAAGRIKIHGNFCWGSASRVFGSMLGKGKEEEKLTLIMQAIERLNSAIPPMEKARGILEVKGFGFNSGTGMVMLMHPDLFLNFNDPARTAMARLGISTPDLEAFQARAAELRRFVGAEDFIALDWFLFSLVWRYLPVRRNGRASWSLRLSSSQASALTETGRVQVESHKHATPRNVKPGDELVFWTEGFWGTGTIESNLGGTLDCLFESKLKRQVAKQDLTGSPALLRMVVVEDPKTALGAITTFERDQLEPLLTAPPSPQWSNLGEVVARWRAETGFPTQEDLLQEQARQEYAKELSVDGIEKLEPKVFRTLYSGNKYGAPGPQSHLNNTMNAPGGFEKVRKTLRFVLHGEGDVAERLTRAISGDMKVTGLGEAVLVKALSIVHAARFIPVFVVDGVMGKAGMLNKLALPVPDDELGAGQRAVAANDRLQQALAPHFGAIQGVTAGYAMKTFLYWFNQQSPPTSPESGAVEPQTDAAAEALFLEKTGFSSERMEELRDLLLEKRQLVLMGPPGTGKTWVAEALATLVAGANERVSTVQFHPAYNYEDFVEGLRPTQGANGAVSWGFRDGILKRVAAQAALLGAEQYVVLILDEINRANLPRVLGECLFALEYRNRSIRLAASGEAFVLPENLLIIGTMNRADRSIAHMDIALRRRFAFYDLEPEHSRVRAVLLQHHTADNVVAAAERALFALNEQLTKLKQSRDFLIGHSYFMRRGLTLEKLNQLWKVEFEPLLRDYFPDDEEAIKSCRAAYEDAVHEDAVNEGAE